MKLHREIHAQCISYSFYCPGCASLNRPYSCDAHAFFTSNPNPIDTKCWKPQLNWDFNGDLDNPTFSPSLLNWLDEPEHMAFRCHLFLREGKIHYCDDCSHSFAGKVIDLAEFPIGY